MLDAKCCGYLSIYNDWSLLESSLRSVAPLLHELVVVDGAYDWMRDYARALGWDPERSRREVYAALDRVAVPYRVISRPWRNEVEKRLAGYEACTGRYVLRIDADEILTFDEGAVAEFFSGEHAIAEMEMPLHATPGWIFENKNRGRIGRQCFIFDREKVPADLHLNYLWLVLAADELPRAGEKPFRSFPKPVAYNAHLSEWRHPDSALIRGSFYTLNWMRAHGVPWLSSLRGRPLGETSDLFREVSPAAFKDIILGTHFIVGSTEVRGADGCLMPAPLRAGEQAALQPFFDSYLSSLADLNVRLSDGRHFINGASILLDATTERALRALAPAGLLVLDCDDRVTSVEAQLFSLFTEDPWRRVKPLAVSAEGQRVVLDLSDLGALADGELRRAISLKLRTSSTQAVTTFRTITR